MSLHSINPLKKSVKKANTRYWQFLLTYFQSKSEKKNNFQKTNTSRASIVHLFENFSSCGRQTKKVLSFSIDFELQILEKQQNNKNQDTRPPMFPLTILKNFNWCSANLSKRRRQLGGEIDFYVKFSLYSNSFCNNSVISLSGRTSSIGLMAYDSGPKLLVFTFHHYKIVTNF